MKDIIACFYDNKGITNGITFDWIKEEGEEIIA